MSTADRIGIRELRQHASRWVQRVSEGHRVEIANRGHLVAMLVPITEDDDPLAAMERAGQLILATGSFSAADLPDPVPTPMTTEQWIDADRGPDRR